MLPEPLHYGIPNCNAVVLIVDDEPMIRKMAKRILERNGYFVLIAEDGNHALKVIEEFLGKVDLVLCDIRMPGPAGLELRTRILKQWPTTKVALLSGDTTVTEIPPDVLTLSKPFNVLDFEQQIRQCLESE